MDELISAFVSVVSVLATAYWVFVLTIVMLAGVIGLLLFWFVQAITEQVSNLWDDVDAP